MTEVGIQQLLEKEGYRFNFFQAVRLLEASMENRPPVGGLGPYSRETVRILPSTNLSFAPSDIQKIVHRPEDGQSPPWTLYEHFLGLYGPNTASPIFIAEMIAQCIDDEDALRDFLDIFNHRILSLYYRAWKKHNIAASITHDRTDPISSILGSIMGFSSSETSLARFDHRRYLNYHNFLSSNSRSADGLEAILSDYFGLESVRVVQFVPRRVKLTSTNHNLVSSRSKGGNLGLSFVLGDSIQDVAGQFKVSIGNLSKTRFFDFQPGGTDYDELIHIIELYSLKRLGFTIELGLAKGQADPMRISNHDPVGRLGRSAWLGKPLAKDTTMTLGIDSKQSAC